MSLPATHQAIIDALIKDLQKANTHDPLQYCANYFNQKLESERSAHLPAKLATNSTTNGKMADTAGPFDKRSPFGASTNPHSIEEEDEERDTFGSPTNATFKSPRGAERSSPFSASPFGAAAAGGAAGGLFGNWLGSSANEEADSSAQQAPANYAAGRRTSVSAESMQPDADSGNWKPPKHHKNHDQLERLKVVPGEVRPYVLDVSWEDAEGKSRFQRIPVGH